jgi:4-hydroxybenzoate polyprenyltransferase
VRNIDHIFHQQAEIDTDHSGVTKVYCLAKRRHEPYLKRTFLTPVLYHAASCAIVVLAAALDSYSETLAAAKITCLFLSVVFEAAGILIVAAQARGL